MAISLRSMMQAQSVRDQALNQNLSSDGETPYTPFTVRELITPQYQSGPVAPAFFGTSGPSVVIEVTDVTVSRASGRFDVSTTVAVTDRQSVDSFEVEHLRLVFEDDSTGFLDAVPIGTVSTFGFQRQVSTSLDERPERIRIEGGRVDFGQSMTQSSTGVGGARLGAAAWTGDGTYESWFPQLLTEGLRREVDSSRDTWANWVRQHVGVRTEHRPTTRQELLAAVGELAHSDGQIRAVGSGHSHSNAPEAPEHYIDLNPADPEEATDAALNRTLSHNGWPGDVDHNGWLKDDATLQQLYAERDHGDRETHTFDAEHLKRVEAGVVLRRLNRHILHDNGYALKNMGSFDGQTVAGAVNTSTHGTGVRLSSFADSVESVEIATVPESASGDPIVRLYRIEPSDGITDREKFEAATANHEMELIQDDDVFYSTVVGYGCMGVAYAYTLHVRDSYWLREETELMTWSQLTRALAGPDGINEESVENFLTANGCRHTQILVNIAADQVPSDALLTHRNHGIGRHETPRDPLCLITRHYEVDPSDIPERPDYWNDPTQRSGDTRWPPERPPKTGRYLGKDLSINLLKPNRNKAYLLHSTLFHNSVTGDPFFSFQRTAWYVALRRLRDGGNNVSEFYNPEPPEPATPTTEVGVALGDIVDAVNEARQRIQTIKQGNQIQGKSYDAAGTDVFFPAPMGLRFTAASEHYLSPEHRHNDDGTTTKTAMLEVPLPIYEVESSIAHELPALTFDQNRKWVVEPALSKLHNHLVFTGNSNIQFDGRPHMGKHNEIGDGWLRANYERYASDGDDETAWLDVYNRFNAFGTFNNAFTAQLGIDN